jgi:acylphosphatase
MAEGERAGVEQFLEALKKGPASARVEAARVEWEPATGEFEAFEVHRSL